MAAFRGSASAGDMAVAATRTTLIQLIAAANHRVKLESFSVSFDGTSNTGAPVEITLERQTDAGTGGNDGTPVKLDDSVGETLQTDFLYGPWATTEPSQGDVLGRWQVHPQSGITIQFVPSKEPILGGGDRLAVTAKAAAAVNAQATMDFEE